MLAAGITTITAVEAVAASPAGQAVLKEGEKIIIPVVENLAKNGEQHLENFIKKELSQHHGTPSSPTPTPTPASTISTSTPTPITASIPTPIAISTPLPSTITPIPPANSFDNISAAVPMISIPYSPLNNSANKMINVSSDSQRSCTVVTDTSIGNTTVRTITTTTVCTYIVDH